MIFVISGRKKRVTPYLMNHGFGKVIFSAAAASVLYCISCKDHEAAVDRAGPVKGDFACLYSRRLKSFFLFCVAAFATNEGFQRKRDLNILVTCSKYFSDLFVMNLLKILNFSKYKSKLLI